MEPGRHLFNEASIPPFENKIFPRNLPGTGSSSYDLDGTAGILGALQAQVIYGRTRSQDLSPPYQGISVRVGGRSALEYGKNK
jgi:hypothetical protein